MNVHVDERLCKGCRLCIAVCPKQVLAMSNRVNQKGYTVAAALRPEDCIGCKLCEKTCPDFAIYVEIYHLGDSPLSGK